MVDDDSDDCAAGNPEEWLMSNPHVTTCDLGKIHPRAMIRNLSIGDFVKLVFRVSLIASNGTRGYFRRRGVEIPNESMWVEITHMDGEWPSVRFRGELGNQPCLIDPRHLRLGSPVSFGPEHVIDVWKPTPASRQTAG